MSRLVALALAFSAIAFGATAEEQEPAVKRNGFVISGDACGASAFSHLVGEDYATVYDASLLPAHGVGFGGGDGGLRTLEYRPDQLNVVVGLEGQIVAVGCF